MSMHAARRRVLLLTLAITALLSSPTLASDLPQEQDTAPQVRDTRTREDVDLEIQLQLLIGTNEPGDAAKIPAALDATIRQLRQTLRFTNYRLGATFLHRIRNGRSLEVKGPGGVLPLPTNPNTFTPSFYQFQLRPVELRMNSAGREVVSVSEFSFGTRVPIMTASNVKPDGSLGMPVVNYENTGITTGLSVRPGETVVVGTMYYGTTGDGIIILMTAKKLAP